MHFTTLLWTRKNIYLETLPYNYNETYTYHETIASVQNDDFLKNQVNWCKRVDAKLTKISWKV